MKYLRSFRNKFIDKNEMYPISVIDQIIDNFDPEYLKITKNYRFMHMNDTILYSYDIVNADPDKDINLSLIIDLFLYSDRKYLKITNSEGSKYYTCSDYHINRLLNKFKKAKR